MVDLIVVDMILADSLFVDMADLIVVDVVDLIVDVVDLIVVDVVDLVVADNANRAAPPRAPLNPARTFGGKACSWL